MPLFTATIEAISMDMVRFSEIATDGTAMMSRANGGPRAAAAKLTAARQMAARFELPAASIKQLTDDYFDSWIESVEESLPSPPGFPSHLKRNEQPPKGSLNRSVSSTQVPIPASTPRRT